MSETETVQSVSMVKLAVAVAVGVLLAAAVVFGIYQATRPQDCALQRLQVASGERAEVDSGCE
jgi:MFS superfamily sulfate permease-like transporter